jgi:hypothetical protein
LMKETTMQRTAFSVPSHIHTHPPHTSNTHKSYHHHTARVSRASHEMCHHSAVSIVTTERNIVEQRMREQQSNLHACPCGSGKDERTQIYFRYPRRFSAKPSPRSSNQSISLEAATNLI